MFYSSNSQQPCKLPLVIVSSYIERESMSPGICLSKQMHHEKLIFFILYFFIFLLYFLKMPSPNPLLLIAAIT